MAYLEEEKLYFPIIIPHCCEGGQQSYKRGSLHRQKNSLLGDKLLDCLRRKESRSPAREKQVGFKGFLKAYGYIPSFWEISPVLNRNRVPRVCQLVGGLCLSQSCKFVGSRCLFVCGEWPFRKKAEELQLPCNQGP